MRLDEHAGDHARLYCISHGLLLAHEDPLIEIRPAIYAIAVKQSRS